ncbi:MAG: hypothetical protein KA498_03915, partial [Neisseriaceae bacterium]|nr:hypothetical protein [Neisseriaceae bacterium]
MFSFFRRKKSKQDQTEAQSPATEVVETVSTPEPAAEPIKEYEESHGDKQPLVADSDAASVEVLSTEPTEPESEAAPVEPLIEAL